MIAVHALHCIFGVVVARGMRVPKGCLSQTRALSGKLWGRCYWDFLDFREST